MTIIRYTMTTFTMPMIEAPNANDDRIMIEAPPIVDNMPHILVPFAQVDAPAVAQTMTVDETINMSLWVKLPDEAVQP